MREAVGGSMLFYIVISFLIFYIVFIGFIMNYASAYRAANYVVSQVENCQADLDNCAASNRDKICDDIKTKYSYVGRIGYSCYDNVKGSVYRVSLGVDFELPFVGKFRPFSVKAETKTIYNISCSDRVIQDMCN